MMAEVGDRLVVPSARVDEPAKDGEIIEVRGTGGNPPYVVRWWEDGHQSVVFPGPDAHVEHEEFVD